MQQNHPDNSQKVKPLRPRGHILTTMNLRPAGGTLRPGGHIPCTMNLRRGCRPVTSPASRPRRRREPGPRRPSRHVRASRRAAPG